MLDAYAMGRIGFEPETEVGAVICPSCATARFGTLTVERALMGLERPPEGWEIVLQWMVDERATDNGYEYGEDCDEPAHEKNGEGFCEQCAQMCCFECGRRLDDGR